MHRPRAAPHRAIKKRVLSHSPSSFQLENYFVAGAASVEAAALSFLAFLVFAAFGAFSFLAFFAFLGASVFVVVSVLVVACANEAPVKITAARNNITIFFMVSIPLFFNRLNSPVGRYTT